MESGKYKAARFSGSLGLKNKMQILNFPELAHKSRLMSPSGFAALGHGKVAPSLEWGTTSISPIGMDEKLQLGPATSNWCLWFFPHQYVNWGLYGFLWKRRKTVAFLRAVFSWGTLLWVLHQPIRCLGQTHWVKGCGSAGHRLATPLTVSGRPSREADVGSSLGDRL